MVAEKYFILDFETTRWDENLENKHKLSFLFGYIIEFSVPEFKIVSESFLNRIKVSDLLGTKNRLNVFYIHNLKFDFLFILESFVRDNTENIKIEHKISSTIIEINVFRKYDDKFRCVAKFRNTFCLWNTSLKIIGKNIGCDKIEHNKIFGNDQNKDKEYVRQDCVVVLRFLEFWYDKIKSLYENYGLDCPNFLKITLTTSSTAKRIFQDFSNQYIVLNDFKSFDDEFRKYYFGARTEVFNYNVCENANYYDFNSLYVSVLIQNDFPTFPIWISESRTEQSFAVICDIDESREEIPLVPERIESKTMFRACIKRDYMLQIEEYEYLRSRNVPVIEKKWVNSAKLYKMFDYLEYFYRLRREMIEAKNPFEKVLKLIGNASYGFFGTRRKRDTLNLEFLTEITPEFLERIKTDENLELDLVGGKTIVREHGMKEVDNLKINILIAGRITALARLKLTKILHELNDNGIPIYYCDTDSIVCQPNAIIEKYVDEKALGMLKIEKSGLFIGFAPKFYVMLSKDNYDFKVKGVPIKIENHEQKSKLEIAKESKQIVEKYIRDGIEIVGPCSIKKMIENNYQPCQIKVLKKQQSFYNKRKINPDKSTSPLQESDNLDEVEESNKKFVEENFKLLKELELK